jgi:hypothetical protein
VTPVIRLLYRFTVDSLERWFKRAIGGSGTFGGSNVEVIIFWGSSRLGDVPDGRHSEAKAFFPSLGESFRPIAPPSLPMLNHLLEPASQGF